MLFNSVSRHASRSLIWSVLRFAFSFPKTQNAVLETGGDGGNRTPVQKIRPYVYYKRILLFVARPAPHNKRSGFGANRLILA